MIDQQPERVLMLVEALTSGKYQQTTKGLRNSSGYCCLGCACAVFQLQTGQGEWLNFADYSRFAVSEKDYSPSFLPDEVRLWYGFDKRDPYLTIDGQKRRASHFNDDGYTFTQIAEGFRALAEQS